MVTLGSVVYGLLALIGVLPHVFSSRFETRGEPRGNFSLAGDLAHLMIGLGIVPYGPSRTIHGGAR